MYRIPQNICQAKKIKKNNYMKTKGEPPGCKHVINNRIVKHGRCGKPLLTKEQKVTGYCYFHLKIRRGITDHTYPDSPY